MAGGAGTVIDELDNTIQAYAWGSHTAIAGLRGETTPAASPQAELWMGAHPLAPSKLSGSGESLIQAIASAPEANLGPGVVARYGAKLPFLLKVLAAETPLSLQAHPSPEQAVEGFAADEAAGIPLDSPLRNYKDRSHKPELLCALTEFWALCGFRELPDTLALLDELELPELVQLRAQLTHNSAKIALKSAFSSLMLGPATEQRQLALRVTEACRAKRGSSRFAAELGWAARLGELYPGDVGVVSALLLNLVRLAPGEAVYLPAGNLHAYLGGMGVEIMASSDNVLRGGLTPKHVNVTELLRVLDFQPLRVAAVVAQRRGAELCYDTPAREFRLSYFDVAGEPLRVAVDGPEIWLVTSGHVALTAGGHGVTLSSGRSAFVQAQSRQLELSGSGRVFRARVAHSA
jgi:mannose-6-phosphate isomerase